VGTPANLWQRWFAASGQQRELVDVREFATLQLAYEAAAAGLGVTLAIPLITEPYMRASRLLPCASAAREIGESYRLYRPRRRARPPTTELRFARWLRKAARKSVEEFQSAVGKPSATDPNVPEAPVGAPNGDSHSRAVSGL